jgi:Rrf2 family cysteine metabolism transcriptional repressor
MKLSTRCRYGTRMLLDLALHQDRSSVFLKDIAQRQRIPLPYLKRLIGPLMTGGILRSTRGARGGVSLARPPEQIRMREVMQLLEGPISLVDCVENPAVCDRSASCVTRDLWGELGNGISSLLDSMTLQDLIERQKGKEQAQPAMYYI